MARMRHSLCEPSEDWQIESDMNTLMRAEEIKRDKKRFEAATKMAKEKLVEFAKVAGSETKAD